MSVRFFKIPLDFYEFFPIVIDNMRVELLIGEDGEKYISERCLIWGDFLAKFDNDEVRKNELLPLYNYVLNSDSILAEIKKEITETL